MKNDDILKSFSDIVDLVIYADMEDETEEPISPEVYEFAVRCTESLWKQVEIRLQACKTEQDILYVKDSTFNFLLFSMRKLLAELDDDEIERMANVVRERILRLKRE